MSSCIHTVHSQFNNKFKRKRTSIMKLAAGSLMAGLAGAEGILNDSALRTGYANSGMSWKLSTVYKQKFESESFYFFISQNSC